LQPGLVRPARAPLQLEEYLECIYQHFKQKYTLTEDSSSQLEAQLRGFESFQANLDKGLAAHADEAQNDAARAKSNKRDRSPAPDGRERAAERMEEVEEAPTEVAPSEHGDDAAAAEALQEKSNAAAEQTPAPNTSPAPPVSTTGAEASGGAPSPPAAAGSAPAPVLGPLGTAPYGAQAPRPEPAAVPLPREDRERSPRRDAEATPTPAAVGSAAPVTPKIDAAAEARIRGDDIGDSLDSLPALEAEEQQASQSTSSNARGGTSFT
jgi:hypothetical protein